MRFRQARPPVLMSYAAFVLVGINVGISGVLLPSQMASYGVGRATIGITFFTSSAGFVLASVSTGALIHKAGIRIALAAGLTHRRRPVRTSACHAGVTQW